MAGESIGCKGYPYPRPTLANLRHMLTLTTFGIRRLIKAMNFLSVRPN